MVYYDRKHARNEIVSRLDIQEITVYNEGGIERKRELGCLNKLMYRISTMIFLSLYGVPEERK